MGMGGLMAIYYETGRRMPGYCWDFVVDMCVQTYAVVKFADQLKYRHLEFEEAFNHHDIQEDKERLRDLVANLIVISEDQFRSIGYELTWAEIPTPSYGCCKCCTR